MNTPVSSKYERMDVEPRNTFNSNEYFCREGTCALLEQTQIEESVINNFFFRIIFFFLFITITIFEMNIKFNTFKPAYCLVSMISVNVILLMIYYVIVKYKKITLGVLDKTLTTVILFKIIAYICLVISLALKQETNIKIN